MQYKNSKERIIDARKKENRFCLSGASWSRWSDKILKSIKDPNVKEYKNLPNSTLKKGHLKKKMEEF